ncbi:MAG: YkgJ family cysteine cluster protein [Thermoprotei archaeon]|nr:MAG: YkgJ family cysteine cluster protein [Thermoprotei archaeon]
MRLPTLYLDCRIDGKLCGKCCYDTKMPLTKSDIERIKKIGFSEDYFVDRRGRIPRLKNIDGHCVFLDSQSNSCMIYPDRPEGCRLYPLVYDVENDKVVVDPLCPKSHIISQRVIRELSGALLNLIDRLNRDYAR